MATTNLPADMAEADALIARWIEPEPRRSGADRAIVGEYGTSVWALVARWRGANGDVAEVAAEDDLPQAAVRAAIASYHQHRTLIDARVGINSATGEEGNLGSTLHAELRP